MNNFTGNNPPEVRKTKDSEGYLAFWWGLAEASFFFIVPDVWLTIISRRRIAASQYKAIGLAVLGALAGGTLIYGLGRYYYSYIAEMLTQIPGISPLLVQKVQAQVGKSGLGALLLGPLQGIPYKIFAAQWGNAQGSIFWFWLVSIPARGIRFVVTAVLTRLICKLGESRVKNWHRFDLALLIAFWLLFYCYYFYHFGW